MKKFLPDYSDADRLEVLISTAESIEDTTFFKPLTREDIEIKNEQFVLNSIEVSKHDDVLEDAKSIYKLATKPLKEENMQLLHQIKTGQEEIAGTVYSVADHENGTMVSYDAKGNFISERRLRMNEKQTRLIPIHNQIQNNK